MRAAGLAILALLSCSGIARADAIGMPPWCPEGTRPQGSHAGEYCLPLSCEDGCEGDHVCEPRRVCAVDTDVSFATMLGAQQIVERETLMTCAADGTCTGNEVNAVRINGTPRGSITCTIERLCVPRRLPTFPPWSGVAPPPSFDPPLDDDLPTESDEPAPMEEIEEPDPLPPPSDVVQTDADEPIPALAFLTPRRAAGMLGALVVIAMVLAANRRRPS